MSTHLAKPPNKDHWAWPPAVVAALMALLVAAWLPSWGEVKAVADAPPEVSAVVAEPATQVIGLQATNLVAAWEKVYAAAVVEGASPGIPVDDMVCSEALAAYRALLGTAYSATFDRLRNHHAQVITDLEWLRSKEGERAVCAIP